MAASTALSPTAHDQDLLVDVVIGLDQPEHHFGRAPRLPEGRGSCH